MFVEFSHVHTNSPRRMSFWEVLLKCAFLFLRIVGAITHPLLVYRAKGKKKKLPPIKNDILKLSATELARRIRKKELSSVEVCKAYIDRITEVNPLLNAVVEDRYQAAIEDALLADNYLEMCGLTEEELEETQPLLGVPLTVKESCGVEGMEYSVGHLPKAGTKAQKDGRIVERLRERGAIPLLVSNAPELCMSVESSNLITGTTNNPYDTTCTCGGSSGGEGALLGAGASVIGIGSDFAGSIRIPASFNGVYGHKPTPRIASIKGHVPYIDNQKFNDFMVVGPMTRYAEDLRLMMKVMVDPGQATKLRLDEKVDLSKLNVFYMEETGNFFESRVQREIRKAVKNAALYLFTQCGSRISKNKKLPVKDSAIVYAQHLYSTEDSIYPLEKGEILLVEFLKSLFGWSKYSTLMLYLIIQNSIFNMFVDDHAKEVVECSKLFVETLGENGVFLYPSIGISARKHNEFITTFQYLGYTMVANAMKLPSTNVPCGLDKNGMPIGIQVIAGPNQDRLCFAVAEQLDKYFGGWIPPS